MNEKIRSFCKLYLGYAAIGAFCLMYVLMSFIELEPTGKTIPAILADGLMAFAFGMGIASMFKNKGLAAGAQEPCVIAAVKEHEQMAESIVEQDEMEELSSWCEDMNAKNYRMQRSKILSRAGMTYHECFTEEGAVLPYTPLRKTEGAGLRQRIRRWWLEERRIAAYNKAVGLRLTELSMGELMSEGAGTSDPYYMERGKKKYKAQTAAADAVSKTVTAVALGYYGAKLIAGFSAEALIWTVVQMIFFLVMGSFKYTDAVAYMVEEYKERRTKKAQYLKKFMKERARGMGAEAPVLGKDKSYEQSKEQFTSVSGD